MREAPDSDPAPSFAETEYSRVVPENNGVVDVGDPVVAVDLNDDVLSYGLEGNGAAQFSIDADGQIQTAVGLDYETRSRYELTVTAADPANQSAETMVVINVTNAEDEGTVTIAPQPPVVGRRLTAVLDDDDAGTPGDPDGALASVSWRWQRSPDEQIWRPISGADTSSYTPVSGDKGHYLRATVTYFDGHGFGEDTARADTDLKTTDSTSTRPIINPVRPGPVRPGPAGPAGLATDPDDTETAAACPSAGASHPFTDVAPTSFANDAITCIYGLGITTGRTIPTLYDPEADVSRAQMAVFLSRLYTAATGRTPPVADNPFTDIAGSFARDHIARIYGLGITTGRTIPTLYDPEADVSRAQMAVFLSRLYTAATGRTPPVADNPFTDIAGSFARDHIARIYGLGITTGTSVPTIYDPDGKVSRAHMAVFLSRLYASIT